jgi:hypothetical protein
MNFYDFTMNIVQNPRVPPLFSPDGMKYKPEERLLAPANCCWNDRFFFILIGEKTVATTKATTMQS